MDFQKCKITHNKIYVSTLCHNSDKAFDKNSYAYKLAALSGGIAVTGLEMEKAEVQTETIEKIETFANNANAKTSVNVKKNNTKTLGEGNDRTYKIIFSTGLTTIKLDQKLKNGSLADKDSDGLKDWDEVNVKLIGNNLTKISYSDLPSLSDCVGKINLSYVTEGMAEIYRRLNLDGNRFKILPLISDPTDADSDNDGIIDKYDNNALKYCENNDDLKAMKKKLGM